VDLQLNVAASQAVRYTQSFWIWRLVLTVAVSFHFRFGFWPKIAVFRVWHDEVVDLLASRSVTVSASTVQCSFRHASPRLWNELPKELRQPVESLSLSSPLILSPVIIIIIITITFIVHYFVRFCCILHMCYIIVSIRWGGPYGIEA